MLQVAQAAEYTHETEGYEKWGLPGQPASHSMDPARATPLRQREMSFLHFMGEGPTVQKRCCLTMVQAVSTVLNFDFITQIDGAGL